MENPKLSPSMVLAAYAERLIEGRRVVVFGSSTSGLAEHLVDRGARLVHVYDPDPGRVATAATLGASGSISFAPLGQGGIAVRDGAFDVGLVDCLAAQDDPAGLMRRLRRALAARGAALVVATNPEAPTRVLPAPEHASPGYYELYELISAEFDEVRMLGQTPFLGYAVAEFNPEAEDDFSIDTAFVPGGAEEPEYYVALASHFPVSVDAFSVVQLPAAEVLQHARLATDELPASANGAAKDAASRAREQAAATIAELQREAQRFKDEAAAYKRQLAELEQQLAERKAQLSERNAQLAEAKRQSSGSGKERELLRQVRAELDQRDQWVQQLESRAATADARADEVQSELERAQQALHKLERELERARQRPAAEQEPAGGGSRELHRRINQLERQLEQQRGELETSQEALRLSEANNQELEADVAALERQLRERGQQLLRLTDDLRKTEALGERLLRKSLNGQRAAADPTPNTHTELEQQLQTLARTDAQRMADLTAARWTIRELEHKLQAAAGEDSASLAAELQQARAEIQRQATLLRQLRDQQ